MGASGRRQKRTAAPVFTYALKKLYPRIICCQRNFAFYARIWVMGVTIVIHINSFGVIGGDKRQLSAARAIYEDGYTVLLSGFDKLEQILGGMEGLVTPQEAALCSEAIVLPLPVTKDGKNLNAPFAGEKIPLDDGFARMMQGKRVYCGMKERLLKTSKLWNKDMVFDYFDREELNVLNAVATSEGALEIAMREYAGTINGSKCLVVGFGRIGKVLSNMLRGLGAQVYVAARKKQDLAWISLLGHEPVAIKALSDNGAYDIIFNTVPALILDSHVLAHIAQEACVIDLASTPGGVDFDSARRMGINAVHALSLPGKVAPKTSGEIIKNTIFNMLEED